MYGAPIRISVLCILKLMSRKQTNIQLKMRPKNIHVSNGNYEVNIFLEEELAITLPVCYNSYVEAELAAREFVLEKLRSE